MGGHHFKHICQILRDGKVLAHLQIILGMHVFVMDIKKLKVHLSFLFIIFDVLFVCALISVYI